MATPQLIIKQKKSVFWYLGVFSIIAILIALSFFVGRFLSNHERQSLIEQVQSLEIKLDESQNAYHMANQSLVMQTQSAKVDNQSNQQLIDNIKQLQDTQLQLEEELKFYRKIMAPELANEGLTIADFEISQPVQQSPARFKLVLTQAGKQEQFLKGKVDLALSGTIDGRETSFPFSELGTFQEKHFRFQFKYFQNIEGEIELPQGFIAKQILIQATTQGLKKNQSVSKQVNWSI